MNEQLTSEQQLVSIQQIVTALSHYEAGSFPEQALEQARAQWPALLPHIDPLLKKFCAEQTLSKAEDNLLFWGLMLLGDRAETSRFEAVVELCNRSDDGDSQLDLFLGDALTAAMPTIFYVLSGGRYDPLRTLLLSDKAGEFVKSAALDAVFAQLENGQLARETLEQDIPALLDGWLEYDFALTDLAFHLVWYHFDEYQAQLLSLHQSGAINDEELLLDDLKQWQCGEYFKPAWHREQVRAQFDVMALKNWFAFNPEYQASPERKAAIQTALDTLQSHYASRLSHGGTFVAPEKIGRNEPCPCGSGKKYKKCCMP